MTMVEGRVSLRREVRYEEPARGLCRFGAASEECQAWIADGDVCGHAREGNGRGMLAREGKDQRLGWCLRES